MINYDCQPPIEFVLAKHTFWGCYLAYRDQIALERGWNDDTSRAYESSILNIIVPNIANHDRRPLSALTKDDFIAALKAIKKAGYIADDGSVSRYDEKTIERFWRLMEAITDAAEKNYLCRNVLAPNTSTSSRKGCSPYSHKVVPRYMPPDIEQRAGEILLTDPMQNGAYMGLAGMLCWGGRNAEAAGLNFGDIKLWMDIPECWVAWIYKSTKIDSNQLQSSGKTRNADRVVLLPNRYVQLILERKRRLQELLGPEVDIDRLPVACRKENYSVRCSADDLTAAAKSLFAQLKLPPEHIELSYDDVQRALSDDSDSLNIMNMDVLEKDPTAYYLRRVYGTSLACVGLSEQDIAFQIGHDLGAAPEYRNELLNTKKLMELKKKLDLRPIVNTRHSQNKEIELPLNAAISVSGESRVTYRLPAETHRLQLNLSTQEVQDEIQVKIHNEQDQFIQLEVSSYAIKPNHYSTSLDTTADYHRLYDK